MSLRLLHGSLGCIERQMAGATRSVEMVRISTIPLILSRLTRGALDGRTIS
jgi:hypothetical protein